MTLELAAAVANKAQGRQGTNCKSTNRNDGPGFYAEADGLEDIAMGRLPDTPGNSTNRLWKMLNDCLNCLQQTL